LNGSITYIRRVPRTRLFRAFAGLASLWLAICMVAPTQLHTCVMHGGLAIDVVSHSGSQNGAPHHGGNGAHHNDVAAAASGEHAHHGQGSSPHSQQCSCIGDCSAGRAPVDAPVAQTLLNAPTVRRATISFNYASASFDAPQFLLPFSNGPPDASSRA
jgi:hypothetical protein